MDQARSRWERGGAVSLWCWFGVGRKGGGGSYYFEDVWYHFVRGDVAVVLEELAGLGADGLEGGCVPLHVFVLCFDVRVDLWYGHVSQVEGRGARKFCK